MITQERLKERLDYNPDTGIFNWKVPIRGIVFGSEAGSLNDQGYLIISVDGRRYRAQRLAWLYMYGNHPIGIIDHIDRNRLNNSIHNLRDIPKSENQKNLSKHKNNSSGYNGVRWYNALNEWHVQIQVDKKKIHIGYFENLEEAINARKKADKLYNFTDNHGE